MFTFTVVVAARRSAQMHGIPSRAIAREAARREPLDIFRFPRRGTVRARSGVPRPWKAFTRTPPSTQTAEYLAQRIVALRPPHAERDVKIVNLGDLGNILTGALGVVNA